MKSDEKVCFAQVDGHLDSNPKIVKAGSVFSTAIFEFLLRRVAISHSNGTVPIAFVDPDYLARTLFMSCDDARHGTSRAVTAKLIAIEETSGLVYVVGWSDEWGRRPKAGAERTASWREREKSRSPKSINSSVTTRDETPSHVTVGDESDTREEKRREKKRREERSDRTTPAPPSRPTKSQLPDDWTPARSEPNDRAWREASTRGVDCLDALARMRDHAKANAWKKVDWQATWRNWLRGSKAPYQRAANGQTPMELQLERIRMLEAEEAREKESHDTP